MTYMYIPRIKVDGLPIRGKKEYLSDMDVVQLFEGYVVVEEKLDGKTINLPIREHTCYECFGEDLRWKHNILYNRIPLSRFPFVVGIDIYDHDIGEWVDYRSTIFWAEGIPTAPVICSGSNLTLKSVLPFLDAVSSFGEEQIEGLVIKNYSKQVFGKIVNPKFDNEVDDSVHWLRKKRVHNQQGVT
jgi:hypothetical protein